MGGNRPSSNHSTNMLAILIFITASIMLFLPLKFADLHGGTYDKLLESYVIDFDERPVVEVRPDEYDSEFLINGISIGEKWNDTVSYVYNSGLNRFESKIMENEYGVKK